MKILNILKNFGISIIALILYILCFILIIGGIGLFFTGHIIFGIISFGLGCRISSKCGFDGDNEEGTASWNTPHGF